ncbi:MAG: hypothetical protein V3V14_10195 [Saprospiraceae bacterium]
MNNNDLEKLRLMASNHKPTPRPEVWLKLDSMLNKKESRRKVINYRNISMAAVIISVICIVAVFSIYQDHHNPDLFASNESCAPLMLEELPIGDNPMYSIENVNKLHNLKFSHNYY